MTLIALPRAELEAIAQQMASGMIVAPVLAQQLDALVKAAPTVDLAHVAEMELEIRAYGQCRGRVHGEGECGCRFCRIARRFISKEPGT